MNLKTFFTLAAVFLALCAAATPNIPAIYSIAVSTTSPALATAGAPAPGESSTNAPNASGDAPPHDAKNCLTCNWDFFDCLDGCHHTRECDIYCNCKVCEDRHCERDCGYRKCCAQAVAQGLTTLDDVLKKDAAGDSVEKAKEEVSVATRDTATGCPECHDHFIDCMIPCDLPDREECKEWCNAEVCEENFCKEECGYADKCEPYATFK
ncbi:hypothetical protein BDV96DRAFT_654489 [Lophiotrema nucula]|uniref:Uncharacterized protein n=1 Tax=Lophiotrema nucula TaxID=690887 RepID=A0A6A5YIZ1_9PLEO|nr:hypothetical protein BDV96DRAFT_654489 [Lophiotrema nucula]